MPKKPSRKPPARAQRKTAPKTRGKAKRRATGKPAPIPSSTSRPPPVGAPPTVILERFASGNTTVTLSLVGDPFGFRTGAITIQRGGSEGRFCDTAEIPAVDLIYPEHAALRGKALTMLLKRVEELAEFADKWATR